MIGASIGFATGYFLMGIFMELRQSNFVGAAFEFVMFAIMTAGLLQHLNAW